MSVVLLLICGASILGQTDKQLKPILQARYDLLVKAAQSKDTKALELILSPEYSSGSYTNLMDRTKTIAAMKKGTGSFKTVSRKIESLIINHNKASVLENCITVGRMPVPNSKGTHLFQINQRCLDTWEKTSKGWQLKHIRILKTVTTDDGKPFKGRTVG